MQDILHQISLSHKKAAKRREKHNKTAHYPSNGSAAARISAASSGRLRSRGRRGSSGQGGGFRDDSLQLGGGVPAKAANAKLFGPVLQQGQQQVIIAGFPGQAQLRGYGRQNVLEQGTARESPSGRRNGTPAAFVAFSGRAAKACKPSAFSEK